MFEIFHNKTWGGGVGVGMFCFQRSCDLELVSTSLSWLHFAQLSRGLNYLISKFPSGSQILSFPLPFWQGIEELLPQRGSHLTYHDSAQLIKVVNLPPSMAGLTNSDPDRVTPPSVVLGQVPRESDLEMCFETDHLLL